MRLPEKLAKKRNEIMESYSTCPTDFELGFNACFEELEPLIDGMIKLSKMKYVKSDIPENFIQMHAIVNAALNKVGIEQEQMGDWKLREGKYGK